MTKIHNTDELRAEIMRLRTQRYQQEIALHQGIKDLTAKYAGILSVVNSISSFFSSDKKDPDGEDQDWMTGVARLGIPMILNKLFFSKSGFLLKTIVGLVSQKAAANVNTDVVGDWVGKATEWVKNFSLKKKKPKKGAVNDDTDYGIPPDSETY